ncbi:MAG: BrnT family toxin [Bdellovibrionales bacterium]
MEFDGFDWDSGNRSKCQKHGVPIAEIESLFHGMPLVGPDVQHSRKEQRFRAVGLTAKGRSLFVVFTSRQNGELLLIRPISARYMHKEEVKAHEKEIPGL